MPMQVKPTNALLLDRWIPFYGYTVIRQYDAQLRHYEGYHKDFPVRFRCLGQPKIVLIQVDQLSSKRVSTNQLGHKTGQQPALQY